MPSKTPAQRRLMQAVSHGWRPDRIKGPSRKVAKEFVRADKAKGYQFGGLARLIEGGGLAKLIEDAKRMRGDPSAPDDESYQPGSIADMLQTRYGITDPTSTAYDKSYDPAEPYAHLNEPTRRQYQIWEAARGPAPTAAEPAKRWELSTDPVGKLKAHQERIKNILQKGDEDVEPVEMQYGGMAGGLSRFAQPRRAGGFPGGGGGIPPQLRQRMMQARGRGRGLPPQGRGRGRFGGSPLQPGGGLDKQVQLGGYPGGGGRVQRGGPGGPTGGRQMLGGVGMPGGQAPPSLRGHLQKMRSMQRPGNRIGTGDQQGGLARALQTSTGRPPISRRMAFPGTR